MSGYKLNDIYNVDEFGLFYGALPSETLRFQGQSGSGGKHSQVQITGMAASNALGEKIPTFVIKISAKPRCFNHFRNLFCHYRALEKAWNTF